MEDQSPQDEQLSTIQERWESIQQVRTEFALELAKIASELPGDNSRRLRFLSRWFEQPASLDDALQRSDVLGICLPLLKAPSDQKLTSAEIAQAARMGFCSVGRESSLSNRMVRALAYPFLILMITSLLAILFSFWIAPEFEGMFAEFGIQLPSMTIRVLAIASFVRRWWWIMVALPIGATVLYWIVSRSAVGQRSASSNWIDQQLMSTRDALGSWAWHISLLLEAGLTQTEAVKNAGFGAGKTWLRQNSFQWAATLEQHNRTSQQVLFGSPKFQLLNNTLQLPESDGKIALLKEVATYYWDRNRTIGDWWIHLLSALMLWVVGFAVFVAVFSLFMPLIAIISGLTSVSLC